MPLSIDLHVKCHFDKKWNKKKMPIFFSHEIFTLYLGSKYLYSIKFLSQGAVKIFLNVRNLQRCIWCRFTLFHVEDVSDHKVNNVQMQWNIVLFGMDGKIMNKLLKRKEYALCSRYNDIKYPKRSDTRMFYKLLSPKNSCLFTLSSTRVLHDVESYIISQSSWMKLKVLFWNWLCIWSLIKTWANHFPVSTFL